MYDYLSHLHMVSSMYYYHYTGAKVNMKCATFLHNKEKMKKSEQIFGLLTLFDGFYRYLHLSIHIFGCYSFENEIMSVEVL